jgi:hypothetical protein
MWLDTKQQRRRYIGTTSSKGKSHYLRNIFRVVQRFSGLLNIFSQAINKMNQSIFINPAFLKRFIISLEKVHLYRLDIV